MNRGGNLRGAWLIVAFVMAMTYRPGHPWSGIVAGILVIVLAGMITMLRLRARQLRHINYRKRNRVADERRSARRSPRRQAH